MGPSGKLGQELVEMGNLQRWLQREAHGEGLALLGGAQGDGDPPVLVRRRSGGWRAPCGDLARSSGVSARRRRELGEPGRRALAEEEREEGKNISKSEK